jgi:hypothetical protein
VSSGAPPSFLLNHNLRRTFDSHCRHVRLPFAIRLVSFDVVCVVAPRAILIPETFYPGFEATTYSNTVFPSITSTTPICVDSPVSSASEKREFEFNREEASKVDRTTKKLQGHIFAQLDTSGAQETGLRAWLALSRRVQTRYLSFDGASSGF